MTDPKSTETGAATKPAVKKRAAKAPAKMTEKRRALLTRLAEDVQGRVSHHLQALIDDLTAREGLKLTTPDAIAGPTRVSMAGIQASGAPGARQALLNWAAAARRAILQAG